MALTLEQVRQVIAPLLDHLESSRGRWRTFLSRRPRVAT